ncbi:MAG: cysteine desulfurase [Deltaproteobacteria bacterium]|nr:cysteine desulfurase [Deltaproteobacteria bacterium]
MAAREVYLDNAATTRVDARVVEAMRTHWGDAFGNPSSLHRRGVEAARAVLASRRVFAEYFRADPSGVVFTSGGTEADCLAVLGFGRRARHVVVSAVEHPAVLRSVEVLEHAGVRVDRIAVDREGRVDVGAFAAAVGPDTGLCSIIHVQNEIGTIEPVAEIAQAVKARNPRAIVHVDAVQSFTKIPFPLEPAIDAVSVSSHKIHGPMGVGALVVRGARRPEPVLLGGGQEAGLRSGTENVPGIVGFGVAAEIGLRAMTEGAGRMAALRDRLWARLKAGLPDAELNGPTGDARAPHNLSVSVGGVPGETVLHALEAEGVFVSTGSACRAKKTGLSPVLRAIGKREGIVEATIRFTLCRTTTEDEVERAGDLFVRVVNQKRAVLSGVAR